MPISVERFVQALKSTGIVTPAEAETLVQSLPADKRTGDADELARNLVRQNKLTRFQAAAIYQDKADGLLLGNYLILDKLGAGGMGQVFRARHRRMDRVVAIKVLSKKLLDSPDAVARFQREAKAAARLTHPNIVTAYDADEAGGMHFLVMEYVDGSDLAGVVKQQGPLPVSQAVDYVLQAARGLEHAHGEGVVHRDIKPSNLLLDKKGTLKILDMGLARMSDPLADPSAAPGADLTHSGSIMGTIDYMAPEQAMDSRQADARSDIYSLGCTLHYLLTARPPYGGDTILKRLTAHQQAAIPLLSTTRPDIPPGFDEVFGRMMAKRQAARFQTSKELVAALESLRNQPVSSRPVPVVAQPIAAQPVAAVPITPNPSSVQDLGSVLLPGIEPGSRKPCKSSSKMPLAAAAVVLLLVAAGAGAWMMSGSKPAETAQSEAVPAIEIQQPAADSQPAAMRESKPAAEPMPESAPVEAAPTSPPGVTPPPEATPAKAEPPVKAAPQSPPIAAPVVPDVPSTQTTPASPPAASPAVAVALAPMPVEQPAAAEAKLPIPGADARRESLKLVRELYKDDFAQAKQPDAKGALAEKLLNESQQTKDDATALYVVLREARDLAVDAANPAIAERAIGMLASRYAVEPLQELTAALEEMTGKPHPAEANRAITETALGRVEEAQSADDFEMAKRLADVALAAARKSKDAGLTKRASEISKSVTAAKQQWDGWQKAQATLKQTPDDPAANLAAGRYLAFAQGDWDQGLAHLAKGPDGPLKDLAAKSLKPPEEAAALAELGDGWFAAAEKAKGKDKPDLRAGAAYWYTQAEPGLTGLVKTIVDKRLAELGGKVAVAPSSSPAKLPETMELVPAPGASMKFRLIPAGTFTMGTPGNAGAELPHQVKITRPFYFGMTEITQAQWLAIMGNNPSNAPGDPECPAQNISWDDCQRFIERCNQSLSGRKFRFRLPTEAEWEYACRAGTTTVYSFGDVAASLPEYGWFTGNAASKLHRVAQLKPNPWGLFDIHGGIWEWCSDWHEPEYYRRSPVEDPPGPATGTRRILRGGSYINEANAARSAERNLISPEIGRQNYGLRLVCEPKGDAAAATVSNSRGSAVPAKAAPRSTPAGGRRPMAFNQADIERNVANWVLSLGSKVRVTSPATPDENSLAISAAAQLPSEPFLVYGIELTDCQTIVDKDFTRIADLANLIAFSARQVPIGDEGVAYVARQRNLRWLYLTNTKVTDAGLPAIEGLTQLRELTVTGSIGITNAGLVHLRGLTELRALWLNSSPITGAGLKHLHDLPMLLSLGLPATKLAESDLKELAAFRTVTFVSIDRTPGATDAGMAALRSMPALAELHIANSSVSDRGLEVLATFPGLKKLHVAGTRVTDAGVQRFKAARPDCEVFR